MSVRCVSLFVLAITFSLTLAAHGQSDPVCTPGIVAYEMGIASGRVGVPYTAKVKSSLEQQLPDGSMVRGSAYTTQARNSTGKTHSEFGGLCFLNKEGKPVLETTVTVNDPASRTFESWRTGWHFASDKTAHIRHLAAAQTRRQRTPEEIAAQRLAQEDTQRSKAEVKTEDLGNRTIAGVQAHGTRITRTIPAGEAGNELPLAVVNEDWNSSELGLNMMRMHSDPRYGKKTWEVVELSRGEPDASLFSPPPGYKIVDDKVPDETVIKP